MDSVMVERKDGEDAGPLDPAAPAGMIEKGNLTTADCAEGLRAGRSAGVSHLYRNRPGKPLRSRPTRPTPRPRPRLLRGLRPSTYLGRALSPLLHHGFSRGLDACGASGGGSRSRCLLRSTPEILRKLCCPDHRNQARISLNESSRFVRNALNMPSRRLDELHRTTYSTRVVASVALDKRFEVCIYSG